MGRNDQLLRRLYAPGGGPSSATPGPPRYGILPALWLVGLVVFGLCSAIVAVGSLFLALRPSPMEQQLRATGIVGATERPWLFHDHSGARDGSAGCVAVDGRLVRFDGGAETARVDLHGADVAWGLGEQAWVQVRQGDVEVTCPFGLGEGADTFARLLRVAAARQLPPDSIGGPKDPRL